MRATFGSPWEAQYWISVYDQARRDLEKAYTWGFPWMYSCRSSGGLSILPSVNLVQNIGFSADSTHTAEDMKRLERSVGSLTSLVHPSKVETNRYADELLTRDATKHLVDQLKQASPTVVEELVRLEIECFSARAA